MLNNTQIEAMITLIKKDVAYEKFEEVEIKDKLSLKILKAAGKIYDENKTERFYLYRLNKHRQAEKKLRTTKFISQYD